MLEKVYSVIIVFFGYVLYSIGDIELWGDDALNTFLREFLVMFCIWSVILSYMRWWCSNWEQNCKVKSWNNVETIILCIYFLYSTFTRNKAIELLRLVGKGFCGGKGNLTMKNSGHFDVLVGRSWVKISVFFVMKKQLNVC